MDFKYKAIDQNNNVVEGVETAETKFDLANYLKGQGLILIDAEETKVGKKLFSFKSLLTLGTVSTHEKISFARNIGAMIEAGLSLSRTLEVMEKQSTNKKLKKIINAINTKIKKGSPLSEALKDYPKVFNNLFVSMVKAGEESGNIVDALNEIASQTENSYLLKKKIKGAMIYPGVILSAMIIIGIFMMIFIVPTLSETFTEVGAELPKSTQFVITLSNFFNENLTMGLIIILLIFLFFYLGMKTKVGRKIFDFTILHIPMISQLVKETNSARTTRTLASLLKAGVPYLNSIKITKETISNSYYIKIIEEAEKKIEMGLQISTIFEENQKYYPAFVAEMIAVGEETGELSPMLFKVASFYENEVEQKTKNMSTVVEPFLMLIVGVAVGFFAISMISPMYSLMENL